MKRFFSYWPVWIFGLLILSPNFLVNLVCQSKSFFSLSGIYFSILSLLLFLTALVIFRVVWIACLILLPFIILLPMELFYIWEYKFPSTAGIIATVFATNYQEAAEYASSYLVYLIIGMILILMVSLFCIYRMKASKLRMKLRFSKAVLVGVIIFLCFAFLKNVIKSNYNILDGTNKTITNIGRTYPFGVLIRFAKFYHEYERSLFYEKNTKNFRFGAFRKRDISGKEVYVLVIGESSRYDHWGINGYKRDTSPTLSKLRHLISFSNIITWFSGTNKSISIMLTRAGARSPRKCFKERTVISAFREAGFYTCWLSNQSSYGKINLVATIYAGDADSSIFMDRLRISRNRVTCDGVLLKPMRKILNSKKRKIFLCIHTMGSHWDYSLRYPNRFNIFRPSLKSVKERHFINDISKKEMIVNAYDNSILYTDWFLGQLINELASREITAFMVYLSDHGESLFDDERHFSGHSHGTKYEIHIPMFVWYSDKYLKYFPDKAKFLYKNRNKQVSTENLFYTLLDMAGIGYKDEDLTRDLASNCLIERKRFFMDNTQGRLKDYDDEFKENK